MRAGCVVVEVEVHVEGEVIQGIGDGGQNVGIGCAVVAAGGVEPALRAGEAVAGNEDELLGAGRADGVDYSLVVLEDQEGWHVVGFVHYAEDYIGVLLKAGGEFSPEVGEVLGGGRFGIGSVTYDTARGWLHGRVIVTHVVVRV